MPSPFPGMNPYLELDTAWSDFHFSFCYAIRAALVPQVQPEFYVKINEHIYVHEDSRRLVGLADVGITRKHPQADENGEVAVLEAPVLVRMAPAIKERVPFLEIFDKENHKLVTIIEMLSPANKKKGPDREQFLSKRMQILDSSVDYVEIDLVRGGPRMPIQDMPKCDYYVLVSRAEQRPEMGLWPLSLRQPLPMIPVPLPDPKREVRLSLQQLLHEVYDEAGYANFIYSGLPQPPLRKQDARWAERFAPG